MADPNPRTLSDMEVLMLMLFSNIAWMAAILRYPILATMTLACVGAVRMTTRTG
jgi:hypothetical protein